MTFIFPTQNVKLGVSFAALLLCSACGGGGGSSTSTPPVAVNQAPSVTTSSKAIITEGQPFELDASQSSDRDGDSLTYSWRQVSGPAIEIASPTASKLSLTAPMLDADESVSFEVSVTDGQLTSSSTVTLDMEDLKTEPALSEATEFGTGGPQTPTQTVGDPSIYEGDKPLSKIIGLTPAADGGYIVHWTASNGGHDLPVSSQVFSGEGEKIGTQTDGVYLGGDRGTIESNGNTFTQYEYGLSFATIQSGDTLYNLNGVLELFPEFTLEYTSTRGLVEGEIDGFGETWFDFGVFNSRLMGGAFTPVGQDNVLVTLSERTTDAADDEDAVVIMTSFVIDKFGQTLTHELGEYDSNGTTTELNGMTATSFGTDSYMAAWSQNTVDDGYDIRMQRATENGILIGTQTTVNQTTSGNQLLPSTVTMADGNIFMTWLNVTGSEGDGREIRARIIRPDGSFATDEVKLGPALPTTFQERSVNRPFYNLLALETNEVLVIWGGGTTEDVVLRGMVFDAEFNAVSNEFLIATGDESERIRDFRGVVLPDNRVILGWFNDYLHGDERPDTSHTVGFYPVGK